MLQTIICSVVSSLIGGAGILGIFLWYFKLSMEKRMARKEQQEREMEQLRIEKRQLDDEIQHCYGRLFFWMYKAIKTGENNGDLEESFQRLQAAEEKKKEFDRRRLAKSEID